VSEKTAAARVEAEPCPAFEVCYRDHYPRLFAVCLRIGQGDVPFAEDVLHDVFLTLHRRLAALDPPENVGAWLYRVAINGALRQLRRKRSMLGRMTDFLSASSSDENVPSADEVFERREDLATLRKSLAKLPPVERIVIDMTLVEGQSQQQIAATLSFSKGYVSKLVSRACARLRSLGFRVDDAKS
jgi:RNA polymerase sigma-70 factor (ECF subfamily)